MTPSRRARYRARWRREAALKVRSEAKLYGAGHQAIRRRLAPLVAAGMCTCPRCGKLIEPGSAWDLGHDPSDTNSHWGAEHRACNRGTAAHRAGNQSAGTSRNWLTA
jgi:hypothetical protein